MRVACLFHAPPKCPARFLKAWFRDECQITGWRVGVVNIEGSVFRVEGLRLGVQGLGSRVEN